MERSADWMEQARGDLEHARFDVQGRFYEWACFSAQQAAGKAVKAVFQKLGSWTRHTSPPGTRTPTSGELPGTCTRGAKRNGRWAMRRASLGSVRIFSPRYTRQQVLDALQAAVPRLRGLLPLRRVVLFGSYARG